MYITLALFLSVVVFRGQSLPLEHLHSVAPVGRNLTDNKRFDGSPPNGSSSASLGSRTGDAEDVVGRTDATFTEGKASNERLEAGASWCLQEAHNATSGCRRAGAADDASANSTAGNAPRRRRAGCRPEAFRAEDDETALAVDKGRSLVGHARGKLKKKKKLKKWLLPLLLAYKLKFFALVPVMISGLVLLVGATGAAGFFFALFAATISIKSHSKW